MKIGEVRITCPCCSKVFVVDVNLKAVYVSKIGFTAEFQPVDNRHDCTGRLNA